VNSPSGYLPPAFRNLPQPGKEKDKENIRFTLQLFKGGF
jgi:predicted small lipoprotein YifL